MEMLQASVACLAMFYPGENCLTGGDECRDLKYVHNMSVKILARMATLVTMWQHIRTGYDPIAPRPDLSYAANLLYMFNGEEPDPLLARIMDACLILHAEHTINASTFAALVAGSTLASPYLVIAAAVGTLAGPLHESANQKVVEIFAAIGSPVNVKPWRNKQLVNKAKTWVWAIANTRSKIRARPFCKN